MSHTNAGSLFFPTKLAVSFPPSPSPFRFRASAGDLPVGFSIPRWFQSLASTAGVAGGVRIGQGLGFNSGDTAEGGSVSARRDGVNDNVRTKAREKKWARNGDSYLDDNSDALPLPMTYPDSSSVSSEEIDRWLQCDPQVEVFVSLCDIKI